MLTLNRETLKHLDASSQPIQGGLYATMWRCETDDHACQSLAACPGNSFFSCDQGPTI